MFSQRSAVPSLSETLAEAHDLASRMPSLLVAAERVAHTVLHGIHGRRRRGPGETFWQFRQLEVGDSVAAVDWRKSAASDHLFVREREWEAAHTFWLWSDLSDTMTFQSHLVRVSKRDRAIVLLLALAELLSRAGERIGRLGGEVTFSGFTATRRLAEAMTLDLKTASGWGKALPEAPRLARFSEVVLLGDFLSPPKVILAWMRRIAALGVRGHLVQILDPAEETLPYKGRVLFTDMSGDETLLVGRVESLRTDYQRRLRAHRETLRDHARRLGWSFLLHHTDRPAQEALLALHGCLAERQSDHRASSLSGW